MIHRPTPSSIPTPADEINRIVPGEPARPLIDAEKLFRRLPMLALTEGENAVDLIAYEVLNLLMTGVQADIGQINLLPKGGRVEKVCIVKDGVPWLRKEMNLHLLDPTQGFTGTVMETGKPLVTRDIWAAPPPGQRNPFLDLFPSMDPHYVAAIKEPVASTMIMPIKRGSDVFCTIELSRYRGKTAFGHIEKQPVEEFVSRYGSLIMDYILDIKNRTAIRIAHQKLNILARLIASNAWVDYTDAVDAYRSLSSADLGFAFFRRGDRRRPADMILVAWQGTEVQEVYFPEFIPSTDSILCDHTDISYPFEGQSGDRRMHRFRDRVKNYTGIKKKEQRFLLECIDNIRSYVIYPLHMLNQDLGAVCLASHRPQFWNYLHMSPFLSLYNSLLKSFLLNERAVHHLSEISLRIHNPGFYCFGALKAALAKKYPAVLMDDAVAHSLAGLDALMTELHEQVDILKFRPKNIHLPTWLRAFFSQKMAHYPELEIHIETKADLPATHLTRASYEQLETIFENLFANSQRAIHTRQDREPEVIGRITVTLWKKKGQIAVTVQDNGLPYPVVSGRGQPQVKRIMKDLGGNFRRYKSPYRLYLSFPFFVSNPKGNDS
ncbi:hypothetical protein DSCO28_65630 [Desulfosarcina ovata subsp. sediminis]|uniref:Histidine kinase domain-containing protein n=1 Tax=Desulfosarcina ovata subsp. sediminis TaxID=885957 RepID=A0A5K8A0E5_9BACT|nr:hypothetical protein [Desulfosarcina ovata]BBO85997.1 hypothetical protein DSCO28_65630 [Desulfosarcina ovata subsp. sediminis]